jgi:cell division protein ZapB
MLPDANAMSSPDIQTLSARIDSLVALAERLMADNRSLRTREQSLLGERDDLQKKNELAKARVEAIILRLKALEAQNQSQD